MPMQRVMPRRLPRSSNGSSPSLLCSYGRLIVAAMRRFRFLRVIHAIRAFVDMITLFRLFSIDNNLLKK